MGHDGKKQCRWCFGVLLHTREQSTLRQLQYPPPTGTRARQETTNATPRSIGEGDRPAPTPGQGETGNAQRKD